MASILGVFQKHEKYFDPHPGGLPNFRRGWGWAEIERSFFEVFFDTRFFILAQLGPKLWKKNAEKARFWPP